MKTTFPAKSKLHQKRINQIKDIVLEAGQDSIAFVILFGSFARGDWVMDVKEEADGNIYEYASDYDFLIITRTAGQASGKALFVLENRINRALKAQGLSYGYKTHNPHFVVEPIKKINSALEKGRYFFSDIKKEGILLYDSGEFELAEAKEIGEEARRRIAGEDYEYWMEKARGFLIAYNALFSEKRYIDSSFHLHQVTENLYACALLVLTGYKPKTHDLTELNHFCSIQNNEFLTIFPTTTETQKQNFELLRKAYVEARYNKEFVITKEQLEYLIARVERLKDLVEEVCREKI